ncbi:MFS transporter [Gilvimarinus sp. DA14]|uniref:MFS transporter n=1 Tax=Gilvimarinus sp. DA14 TaxID=2956798 RepID=UPI0020B75E4F|nr:MFS transporter [Gilvimarinus sp. DA14]UTF58921.1 MFS transporter [Gilvimarinus sp. DA14]
MWTIVHPISAILGSVALLLLGGGLLNTLLTVSGSQAGFSTATVGFIMSGYFVGFMGGTFVSGRLIAQIGHIRAFAFCAALSSSIALMHSLWHNPYFWFLLRVIYGVSFVTLVTVTESWLNARASKEERGKVFASYMVVNLSAIALAQQLLGIQADGPHLLFSLTAIFICLAVLPITITSRSQPQVPSRPKSTLKKVFRLSPLAVAAAVLSGLAMGAFWSMAPLFAASRDFDLSQVGWLMSITIIGGALLQMPIGRYSDKHDRRRVLTVVCAVAAIAALAMTVTTSDKLLLALFFLWGGMSFSVYPLAVALIIDLLEPEDVVSGSTDMLVLHGAGSVFAPIVAGNLMNLTGPNALPIYIAIVFLVLGSYAVFQVRKLSTIPAGDPAHFEPMVQTSPEILEMTAAQEESSQVPNDEEVK